MRVLDLFSGIGGFSLGLERAGMKTVAFCEIDPFCRKVLKKHWPEVPIYDDVRSLSAAQLARDGIGVDVICGGFPCQDISVAGKGAGLAGERSGLWREYSRLVGELRPQYVIVENVAALLSRGLGDVLGDLAALGYDAEWHCIPASYVGAPHRRDRVWIVAHSSSVQRNGREHHARSNSKSAHEVPEPRDGGGYEDVACANHRQRQQPKRTLQARRIAVGCGSEDVADASSQHVQGKQPSSVDQARWQGQIVRSLGSRSNGDGWWGSEPAVGRVANGVPNRVDRLRSLGNAVVPQIPELIGRAIMEAA